jgi:RinA family phage transcriptional activator
LSKPRFWWYYSVVAAIGQYRNMINIIKDKEAQNLIANYSAMPRSGGVSRSTENAAMRALSAREYEEYIAIKYAVEAVLQTKDGNEILRVVSMYHWDRLKNFDIIASKVNISERTARRRNSQFVYLVAKNMRYM